MAVFVAYVIQATLARIKTEVLASSPKFPYSAVGITYIASLWRMD